MNGCVGCWVKVGGRLSGWKGGGRKGWKMEGLNGEWWLVDGRVVNGEWWLVDGGGRYVLLSSGLPGKLHGGVCPPCQGWERWEATMGPGCGTGEAAFLVRFPGGGPGGPWGFPGGPGGPWGPRFLVSS